MGLKVFKSGAEKDLDVFFTLEADEDGDISIHVVDIHGDYLFTPYYISRARSEDGKITLYNYHAIPGQYASVFARQGTGDRAALKDFNS